MADTQSPPAVTDARIHQIYYSEQTRAELDPGFLPLDNSANERPDWREYWPIRRFLLGRRTRAGLLLRLFLAEVQAEDHADRGRRAAISCASAAAPRT